MERDSLVYLSGVINQLIYSETFKVNVPYRCINISETDEPIYLVNGFTFTNEEFKKTFVFVYDRMIQHFESLGLIKNGKPISKTAFGKLADIHQYGRGRNSYYIWYFRNTKETIYGFYPMQGNKKEQLDECYKYLCELVSGNMEPFDSKDVMFGNRGFPIVYSKLQVW